MKTTRRNNAENAQFIVINEKKGITIVGRWFEQTKSGEASLYDEKTADLILSLMKVQGVKGFQKVQYLGGI